MGVPVPPEAPVRPSADPIPLTPDNRFREVAAILARGLLRLQLPPPTPPILAPQNLPESPPGGLEVVAESRLSGPVG